MIGESVHRKEDRPLLTGRGRFVADFDRPGTVHAAVLRSPLAHARIGGIDTAAATRRADVIDVITAADLPDVRIPMRMYSHPGMEQFLQPPLAREVVRYSGEPVAVVVAQSRYAAEDALEVIEVDYQPLDVVLDPARALDAEAPILHESGGTNLASTIAIAKGDTDSVFADADLVVEERLSIGRHGAVPLEPRGVLAEVSDGRLTVWGAAKIVHINHGILAGLLDWPAERIRLVELHVGGGFGGRGEFYPEDYLIPFLAIRTERPVAWGADREEELRTMNHSREQQHDVALALGADGTLLALRDDFLMNTGAYVRTHGAVVPNMSAALMPGPYAWRAFEWTVRQVVTNKTPAGTYRAPGRYEANFVRERMIDIAAHRLDLDPTEIRRKSLVPASEMPYAVGTHAHGHPIFFDSGDYPTLLDKGLEHAGYEELRRWRDEDPGRDRRRGLGVAMFVEKSGIGKWEYAQVELATDGETVVRVGSASVGQGLQTVMAQICARHLGVPYEKITVEHGDTDAVPEGMGSFGSRATSLGGSSVMMAAERLRGRLLEIASEELEVSAEDLVIDGDRVVVSGAPETAIRLDELARVAGRPATSGRSADGGAEDGGADDGGSTAHDSSGGDPGSILSEEARFESEDMSYPYGFHVVAVELDVRTGGVEIKRYAIAYDIGLAINPQLVEGQIVGGAAQGIGGALFEDFAYDDAGQLVSGSFMDYLLPTAGEVPTVDVLVTEDAPSPLTPLGAKGAGEGGTAAAGGAIANAVSDALGVEATALPITPEWVQRHGQDGRSGRGG